MQTHRACKELEEAFSIQFFLDFHVKGITLTYKTNKSWTINCLLLLKAKYSQGLINKRIKRLAYLFRRFWKYVFRPTGFGPMDQPAKIFNFGRFQENEVQLLFHRWRCAQSWHKFKSSKITIHSTFLIIFFVSTHYKYAYLILCMILFLTFTF